MVKNPSALPETQETWVQSLGQEDSLEEETATCSRILAWKIPWTEEPGRLEGRTESDTTEGLSMHAHTHKYKGVAVTGRLETIA